METNREIVCILCPNGCRMKVFIDDLKREAAELLRTLHIQAPVDFHQVLLSDILGTGADIIATKQVLKA